MRSVYTNESVSKVSLQEFKNLLRGKYLKSKPKNSVFMIEVNELKHK